MTAEDYRETLKRMWLVAHAMRLELEEIREALAACEMASAVAPILDPSLWIANQQRFEEDAAMLRACLAFAQAIDAIRKGQE